MKNLLAIAMLLCLPALLSAQTHSINKFYNKYKHTEETMNFTIPGWIIRLGSSIAKNHVDEPQEKAALKLAKKIRKIKLLVMEDQNTVKPKDIQRLVDEVKAKDHFEELIYVRDGDTRVNMLIRNSSDMIENMLILVSEEDEFVMVSMKTRLRFDDLNEFLKSLEDEIDFDLDLDLDDEEEEEKIAVPVVKEKQV